MTPVTEEVMVTLYAQWINNGNGSGGGPTGKPSGPSSPTQTFPPDIVGEPATPILPSPSVPGHILLPGENGTFLEIGENEVPLGIWKLNEENVRIYEELIPLSGNPLTGCSNSSTLTIAAMSMILSGFYLKKDRKRKN